jgi:methylenetetrahydrofolate dehydrogenase (NADP+) / methenyltetrahydrofolate cyclohydrolase
MSVIDGKALAAKELEQVRRGVSELLAEGLRAPGFAGLLLGGDSFDRANLERKRVACDATGMHFVIHDLPGTVSHAELLTRIAKLNSEPTIDGIFVQYPLPEHLHTGAVLEAILPAKDIDGFHPYNLGRLLRGEPLLRPCASYGIIRMLGHIGVSLKGLQALIVGSSDFFGRPMCLELLLAGANTTVCHADAPQLRALVGRADLLVVNATKPKMIPGEWLREGAIVIDGGSNRLKDGALVGDVDFESARERASWITPVPGGMGPMTVAMLLRNTLDASRRIQNVRTAG